MTNENIRQLKFHSGAVPSREGLFNKFLRRLHAAKTLNILASSHMLNLASKYHFVFKDLQVNLLLMLIEEYVNGAELQITRIERTRKSVRNSLKSICNLEKANWETYRKQHLRMFCDAHFYFICIGQVSRCLDRLRAKLKNRKLEKIYSEFQKTFSQEIRNDLEHIDARAVGLKKKGRSEVKIGNIQDFRNFSNDNLTFNGKNYPVNKESLKKLKEFFQNTISVIHEDYALKAPFFVYDMEREKQLKRIMRIAQKEYQSYLHSKVSR